MATIVRSASASPQQVTVIVSGELLEGRNTFWTTTFTFELADSCDGGCSACKQSTGPAAPLGSATVENKLGPYVTFNLGAFSLHQTAGILLLNAQATSASLSTPNALCVPYIRSNATLLVDVVTNNDGVIAQVAAPEGLVNVAVVDAYQYQLQMFYSNNVTAKTNGFYGTNAPAFDTWTIQNPNGSGNNNQLVVTESATGNQFTYTYTTVNGVNQWQLTDGGGIRTIASWQAQDPVQSNVTNVFTQVLSGNQCVKMTQEGYIQLDSSSITVLSSQIDGQGPTTNITTYAYYSPNSLQQVNYPNGNWEYYVPDYDNPWRVSIKYAAFGNSSPPSNGGPPDIVANPYIETDYDYDAVVSGDDDSLQPSLARTEITSWPVNDGGNWTMQEISRIYRSVPSTNEVDEYLCPTPGANWNDPANLITRTFRYVNQNDPSTFNQIQWQVRPDGTATIYNYQEDVNGLLTNIVISTGQPDSITAPTTILNGSQTQKALNTCGQVTSVASVVITNGTTGLLLSQETYTYTDPLQLDYYVVDLANRTYKYFYSCCGLGSTTDPDGVIVNYTYDNLKRQVATTTQRGSSQKRVTVTNILDAADRVLTTRRIATGGGNITLNQFQYDVLGRVICETNALGGVTTHTNVLVNNQVCITNIFPDGGTRIEVYYSDGRLQSLSGTAVAPVQYQYGAEQDDGIWRAFTLQTKPDANGGTSEWIKTYTDGAGQLYKTVYPGPNGNNAVALSWFNAQGQLTNQLDPDLVSTLFAYNAKGERVLTAVDMDQNGNIDFGGVDRITFTTNDVTTDHGANVLRTSVYVWSTLNGATSNLIATTETSTDGLKTWNTVWNNGVGTVSQTTTVYGNQGYRYLTNTAPDGSCTATVYQYGLLNSIIRRDSTGTQLSRTTYGYDSYFRQITANDFRNGTTTYSYNNADLITSVTTPNPGTMGGLPQTTITSYNNMLQATNVLNPDGTSVVNTYDLTGVLAGTSGSRTYPVAYTYDAQGRMKTLTTWTNYPSGNPAITTWNYDIYRGWLTNKTYADATGPIYGYTAAGRLAQRAWARGTNTVYSYNNGGDLSAITYSDSSPGITYTYDRLGRQTNIVQNGMTTTRIYDSANNLLSESYSGGPLAGLAVTNIYDQYLRRTNLSAGYQQSELSSINYAYDNASRLKTVTDNTGATAYSATYNYLANSPLVSNIIFMQASTPVMTATKSYDYLNRLGQMSSATSGGLTVSFGYSYNSANQRTRTTLADYSYWLYNYDSLGQVISGHKFLGDQTPAAGQQFDYTFDTIGNRRQTLAGGDQNGGNQRSASYTITNLNQYTQRTVPGYADLMGLSFATNTVTVGGQTAYRKGEYFRDQLPVSNGSTPVWTNIVVSGTGQTSVTGGVFVAQSPEHFSYDADGNLIQDGRWIYGWDAENRLVSLTPSTTVGPQISLKFEYDSQGRRIHKQVWPPGGSNPTNDVLFLYDGWNQVAELNATNGAIIRSFMWGLDVSGSTQGAGGVGGLLKVTYNGTQTTNCLVAFDGNGNLSALVNASDGTAVAQYEYGPFGELLRATGPMAKANPFRFSTQYQDDETDLLMYLHRPYSASTGRFLSRDPIGEPGFELLRRKIPSAVAGGPNRYLFVNNDPVDKSDALGLQIWTGTTIDMAINTCLQGPNPAACLAELLEDADLTAAQRAVIKGLMEKAKRVGACYAIYAEYKAAEKIGAGCVAGLTCEEYKKKVAGITAEVAGRAAWLGRKCDDVCPGSIKSKGGSKGSAAGHAKELAEKTVYLGKCAALMKAACGEE
jgi:RHS repeat-associated protein